jgi:hypothetical protein
MIGADIRHFVFLANAEHTLNPILHTWIRDSCFTCDGSKTIQDFPLLFNIGYGILSMHRSSLSNSEGPVSIQGGRGAGVGCLMLRALLLYLARPALLYSARPALLY